MNFDGALLKRGFWLYVWDIISEGSRHLYVGRTGDSSSPHASSPFARIGRHLDHRPNAKDNALARQLALISAEPDSCSFQMVAIGPIYPEQATFAEHVPYRDRVGALEARLAETLRSWGYSVLGSHSSSIAPDPELFRQVMDVIDRKLAPPHHPDHSGVVARRIQRRQAAQFSRVSDPPPNSRQAAKFRFGLRPPLHFAAQAPIEHLTET